MPGEVGAQNAGGGLPTVHTIPFVRSVRAEGRASETAVVWQGHVVSVGDGRETANLPEEKQESIESSFSSEHFPGAEDPSGLAKQDKFFQDAKALSKRPRLSPHDWMWTGEAAKALEETKQILDGWNSMMREADSTGARAEQRVGIAQQQTLPPSEQESTSRVDPEPDAAANQANSSVVEQRQPTVGRGRARDETLSWAEEAKQVFTKFLGSIANGLSSIGRFIADSPNMLARIWAAMTSKASAEQAFSDASALIDELPIEPPLIDGLERKGRASVEQAFVEELMLPKDEWGRDDQRPARNEGKAQHICYGMAKDVLRDPIFIGGKQLKMPSGPEGESEAQLTQRRNNFLETVAEALLEECGDSTDLCMNVSYFAFQIMFAFPLKAISDGKMIANEDPNLKILSFPGKGEHEISIMRLPSGGVRLDFNLKFNDIQFVQRAVSQEIEFVDVKSPSNFSCSYAMVVNSDLSVAPYPLKPDSDDKSAVHYEFKITF